MMLGVPVMLFLEHKMGSVRLLQVYLLCGLAALGTECCMPLSQGVMIGASGAIMGCFAASCAIMKKGPLLGALSLGLLFLSTVPNLQGLSMALLGGNIAYAAHIGGVLMGLFLMAGKQKKST
jgi:rhomboid protease GluP